MGSLTSSSSSPSRRPREAKRVRSDSPTLRTDPRLDAATASLEAAAATAAAEEAAQISQKATDASHKLTNALLSPPTVVSSIHSPNPLPVTPMYSSHGSSAPSEHPTMSPTTGLSPTMSPNDYSQNNVDYTSYPEVVEAERAADSSPQVRVASHFPEDHALASKMPADQQQQQQQYGGYAASSIAPGISGGQSPTTTVGTTTKESAFIGEAKALPAVPAVPAAYNGGNGGGGGGAGAAAEGGSPKTYSRKVVYVLVGLLILVMVLAGAIGGAVGSKAVNDAKTQCLVDTAANANKDPETTDPTPTPSPSGTPTSSADMSGETFSVPTQGFVQLDCPSLNGQTMNVDMGSLGWEFDLTCGASFSRGANSDIMAIISYSFYHCLQACASYNQKSGRDVCVGAEFDSDLSTAFELAGNCFLSNSTSKSTVAGGSADKNLKLVGVLKSSK